VLGINQQFDAAGGSRLPSDESFPFERQHHLVNRRRRDAKILLHAGLGRRPAMQGRAPGFAFTQFRVNVARQESALGSVMLGPSK
jgi:hypothetical protein